MLRFFSSVTTEIRLNRVDHVINDAPAAIVTLLSKNLEPRLLWDKIFSRIRYWADDQNKDFAFFVEEVTKTYVDIESYADLSWPTPDKTDKSGEGSGKPKRSEKQNKERWNAG